MLSVAHNCFRLLAYVIQFCSRIEYSCSAKKSIFKIVKIFHTLTNDFYLPNKNTFPILIKCPL